MINPIGAQATQSLDYVSLSERQNVEVRKNKNEYYAVETIEGIKVHIIQLHFSDNPPDPNHCV